MKCEAALSLAGAYYACLVPIPDGATDHRPRAHENEEARAIWKGTDR